jgi:hypothetical protein
MINVKRYIKNFLLPSIIVLPFLISKICLLFFRMVTHRNSEHSRGVQSTLCIEAGIKGWEIIEFKEIYSSACEYLSVERVYKLKIESTQDYVKQVHRAINDYRPTHYCYSPRTGSQQWLKGLWQSFRLALLFTSKQITPIVILSDLPIRSWRAQAAVITAISGVVVTLMSPRQVHFIFPHKRLIGPSLMPFSQATLAWLDHLPRTQPDNNPPRAIFTGSLYEPRTSLLSAIKVGLEARGLTLDIQGRQLGSPRVSDEEYWLRLANADIVVTTADQMIQPGADWTWVPHLLYRYLEVVACGTLLVAPEVPGIGRFFTSGEHFVSFKKPEDAIDAIEYYLNHPVERGKIAKQGYARARALIESRIFWLTIDVTLGHGSLT